MLIGILDGQAIKGRRVAVTGLGAVTCCGIGTRPLWERLLRPDQALDRRIHSFDPSPWLPPKEVRRLDRFAQFSVVAAQEALDDAGDIEADPEVCGVIFASGAGGFETLAQQVVVHHEKGPDRVSPFLVPAMMANAGAANISIRLGWRGPSETIVTACAAGTHAIGAAARLVANGRCDVVMTGGAEASMHEVAIAAFANMKALSPSGQSRPFDSRRDGFVMGEGAGALVLEDWEHAVGRGARIYAEIMGAASTSDAFHITAPSPDGKGASACMRRALEDAGLGPHQIAHINAHGTSTPLNDLAESRAIRQIFGDGAPPVTSTKGLTGHSFAAAGAIEAVASILAIRHKVIPPTAGLETQDPEIALDVVQGEERPWVPGPVLSNSFGFGGHNGCLVIAPGPEG
ncbi:MAG: beta-ketoacyl-ACP synthase II [Candidatus Dormibacteraeota bacterium]|nr:beta-ketoacyl-ACP synthase II [Candidatus Dormibacteraeota bacterium]